MRQLMVVVALTILGAVGCAKSDTVAVTGSVTMKGQPVDNAEVVFNPKTGRFATGVTDTSGRFSLSTAKPGDGAMPGEYVVTLGEYYPPDKPPAPPKGGGFLPSRFPKAYADQATSPLKATVERGKKNDFSFEVK